MNILKNRRHLILCIPIILISIFGFTRASRAQGPEGHGFGFGIILGEPLGATIKAWTNPVNAFVVDLGASYFGALRLQGDYLWHFDAFHSHIVKMYAGPGLAIGFGNGRDVYYTDEGRKFVVEDGTSRLGVGVRAIFGLNIIPTRTPVEIFAEVGPLIGFVPSVGVGIDFAVGVRFYP